ncbi:MAG TPA: response regulator transcription factor [Gaiellaceae bacterium]|jgi:DNA-binding NarL/FixJ family response regulator|nr:response regulator transcription factor [Gaiellaceae bacterium]
MRVLLADDHALFRAGIASLLKAWGMEIVGQAANGIEAIELTRRLKPELVLMDVRMTPCNGLEATRVIKTELPDVKVIIVTVSEDDQDLFEAVKSGAEGYLLKDMSEEELSSTLDKVSAGEPALSPGLAARILDEFARMAREGAGKPAGPEGDLTDREREVLRLVADGATNREIASQLYISQNTVSFHMKNILAKLHLKNRAQAAAFAIRSGLADDPER